MQEQERGRQERENEHELGRSTWIDRQMNREIKGATGDRGKTGKAKERIAGTTARNG